MYGITPHDDPQRHPHRLCFLAGYFLADWIRGPRVRPIEIVCSHVDYLSEHADEVTSSERWRTELSQLKDECEAVPER
jgi:hypothetical protein